MTSRLLRRVYKNLIIPKYMIIPYRNIFNNSIVRNAEKPPSSCDKDKEQEKTKEQEKSKETCKGKEQDTKTSPTVVTKDTNKCEDSTPKPPCKDSTPKPPPCKDSTPKPPPCKDSTEKKDAKPEPEKKAEPPASKDSPCKAAVEKKPEVKPPCEQEKKEETPPCGVEKKQGVVMHSKGTMTDGPCMSSPDPPEGGSFKRPERRELPAPVVLGFIPVEWPEFFYNKTGATGFYTFLVTFGTYLISKEKFVMGHEYYGGLSMLVIMYAAARTVGPGLARELDAEVDAIEEAWIEMKEDQENTLNRAIAYEERQQRSADGELMLIDAKKENVAMQLETAFRERQMQVYRDVKNLLDYHVMVEEIQRRMVHRNIVEWVTKQIVNSFTPEKDSEYINSSMETLATLVPAYHASFEEPKSTGATKTGEVTASGKDKPGDKDKSGGDKDKPGDKKGKGGLCALAKEELDKKEDKPDDKKEKSDDKEKKDKEKKNDKGKKDDDKDKK